MKSGGLVVTLRSKESAVVAEEAMAVAAKARTRPVVVAAVTRILDYFYFVWTLVVLSFRIKSRWL